MDQDSITEYVPIPKVKSDIAVSSEEWTESSSTVLKFSPEIMSEDSTRNLYETYSGPVICSLCEETLPTKPAFQDHIKTCPALIPFIPDQHDQDSEDREERIEEVKNDSLGIQTCKVYLKSKAKFQIYLETTFFRSLNGKQIQ